MVLLDGMGYAPMHAPCTVYTGSTYTGAAVHTYILHCYVLVVHTTLPVGGVVISTSLHAYCTVRYCWYSCWW